MRVPLIVVAGLAAASPAFAQKAAGSEARAAAFQSVLDCRKISESAARLACYDAAAAKMGEAETRGDIVVIDRAQASAAHRGAFGLKVPNLEFVNRALKAEEVDRIDGVVKAAWQGQSGRWNFELEDGAKWRQISGDLMRRPKSGSKVRIRKGTLGSFLMNVDEQASIKVHRDE